MKSLLKLAFLAGLVAGGVYLADPGSFSPSPGEGPISVSEPPARPADSTLDPYENERRWREGGGADRVGPPPWARGEGETDLRALEIERDNAYLDHLDAQQKGDLEGIHRAEERYATAASRLEAARRAAAGGRR